MTVRNNPNVAARRHLQFDRKLQHDLYGSYEINEDLSVYGGVNNVTDEQPDLGELSYPVSPLGRYMFLGLNWRMN